MFSFCYLIKNLPKARFSNSKMISNCAPTQTKTLNDQLILVSKHDEYIGQIDKLSAHLNETIEKGGNPHRAFSIFLFDQNYRLLLQKRAAEKITFPFYWTNTCCSHPLHNEEELETQNDQGIKLAAQKRLKFETNIEIADLNDFIIIEKIFYKSSSCNIWGENEVDYVIFAKKEFDDKKINFNINEIADLQWINHESIFSFLESKEKISEKTTPWMKFILNYKLIEWWKAFSLNKLTKKIDSNVIQF